MDIWARGIHTKKLKEGDSVVVDGLISPYAQLFPGDPRQRHLSFPASDNYNSPRCLTPDVTKV
jgi:hypothetical protein